MTNKLILTSYILMCFCITNAQWAPDVRLTNQTAVSQTGSNNGYAISANGNIMHIVWNDNRDGNMEIYYKRSTDEGISWGADTRLTNDVNPCGWSSVSVSGSIVHVIWQDYRDGNSEIYYKRSSDEGISWGSDTRLTNDPALSGFCSIDVSDLFVHIVWDEERNGNRQVYYKQSTDGGISWGSDTRLTYSAEGIYAPSVSVSGTVVHIVWTDQRDGHNEIYYKKSTNAGVSWGNDTRLTNDPYNSWLPAVSVLGSQINVVWSDSRNNFDEIYFKQSTNEGASWGPDTRLTFSSVLAYAPTISSSGTNLHIVWIDVRDQNYEIYYKRSTDGGINWEPDVRLTNNPSFSLNPFVSVYGSVVHVIWYDQRDGNREIYYKRNPNGNITGINYVNSEIPKEFKLYQNYPNPFNPATKIEFQIPLSREVSEGRGLSVKLIIYDILGRGIATLVNEQLQPGTYEVEWNAANYPSGVYYYRLLPGDNSETKEMILVK